MLLTRAQALHSEFPLRCVICDDTTGRTLCIAHETYHPYNYSVHVPEGIPTLRVIVAHAHADTRVLFKSAVRRNHFDSWRFMRVLFWEDEAPEVEASGVRAVFQAEDEIVPAVNVVGIWAS